MPLSLRHHPERKYYGEDVASDAVWFLNDFHGISLHGTSHKMDLEAGRERILSLLGMLRPLVLGKPAYVFGGDLPLPNLRGINRLLTRYHSSPSLGLKKNPRGGLLLERPPASSREKKLTLIVGTVAHAEKTADALEHDAALAVLKLAELNSLDSLKTCKQCGLWFFAKFSHQQFCCKKCRIKNNSSSDEWKAYKREKAREYYQLHKSGKVRER